VSGNEYERIAEIAFRDGFMAAKYAQGMSKDQALAAWNAYLQAVAAGVIMRDQRHYYG